MSFHTETTLAGYARTAVCLKTRMDAYCRSSGGRHYLTTFAEAFHDNAYPGQAPTPDLVDARSTYRGPADRGSARPASGRWRARGGRAAVRRQPCSRT
jgi:hypothetical protein